MICKFTVFAVIIQTELFYSLNLPYLCLCKLKNRLKQMKKIIAAILVMITLFGADKVAAQFRYGPMVGIDITNLTFKQDLFTVDQSVGYSAGLATELMFPGIGFGIDAGILARRRYGRRRVMAIPALTSITSRFRFISGSSIPISTDWRIMWLRTCSAVLNF